MPLVGSGSLFSTYLYLHDNKINKKGPTIIHKSVIRAIPEGYLNATYHGGAGMQGCFVSESPYGYEWNIDIHGIKKKSNNMAQFDTPMRDGERVYDALVDMVHVIILTCPFFLSRYRSRCVFILFYFHMWVLNLLFI